MYVHCTVTYRRIGHGSFFAKSINGSLLLLELKLFA